MAKITRVVAAVNLILAIAYVVIAIAWGQLLYPINPSSQSAEPLAEIAILIATLGALAMTGLWQGDHQNSSGQIAAIIVMSIISIFLAIVNLAKSTPYMLIIQGQFGSAGLITYAFFVLLSAITMYCEGWMIDLLYHEIANTTYTNSPTAYDDNNWKYDIHRTKINSKWIKINFIISLSIFGIGVLCLFINTMELSRSTIFSGAMVCALTCHALYCDF
ncbi:uncharacterized protein TRIADDRAFT_57162 [Trichoplax adhaerens]|uniref:Uncharacterized protein n=1 Tax=Trichoplax adhaerens TaxID=10228 RepID=B3S0T4_TRIAD|nr:predicted protein [Trichoplax adhaerens]EDV23699.1 predicted protein [Trichoplax adhaerens]|eukprot:XP_002113225.1 predicted protein [Trichoplax adhaerens]